MSNMSDEKKARLEAIRAAKRAEQEAAGAATPAATAPVAAATTKAPAAPATTAAPAVGANMSDDKKAKLEAIRAANAAKKAAAGTATPVATAPAGAPAARPAAAPAAAPAAKPAARPVVAAKPNAPVQDDRAPRSVLLKRAIIGAIVCMLLFVMLATMTGKYLEGAIWGLILGAVAGPIVLSWPPQRTTSE